MTEPREVTVSDGEIEAFATMADLDVTPPLNGDIRAALAAFIARRVPDVPKTMPEPRAETVDDGYRCGCVDFRDKVLKGV